MSGVARVSASWDYGDGRHGSYVLTTNATVEQLYETVRLASDPAHYDPGDSNAVPNFQSLTITNGATLTANPWDGSRGGRIALKVEATLAVASGSSISANGIGFRGGGFLEQGESFIGRGGSSQTPNAGGGGGGYLMANGYWTSAGGGGYATGGGSGGGNPYATYNGVDYRGAGGGTYGDQALSTIYLGSGGGGGGVQAPPPYSYPFTGGGGGGAIVLNAGNLEVNGQIQANGGVPHYEVTATATIRASGGGGSGGSIVLRAKTARLGADQITANGGSGSDNGGGGGVGRIMLGYFSSYTGNTAPAAYTLLDTNSDNITIITIQPASQTAFWSSNAVMDLGIAGYPPFLFQWYFNSTPISGATNQTLALTGLDFTNQGNYSVTVSNAVMTVVSSNVFLTVLDGRDFDGDGIPNYWERQFGLDPTNPLDANDHPPGDRLTYLQKYRYGLYPTNPDADGLYRTSPDTDHDGLSDYDELFVHHSDPKTAYSSDDGIPDLWKVQHGMNPSLSQATEEVGSTGVTYGQLYEYDKDSTHTNQLDPHNPFNVPGMSLYEALNDGRHTNRFFYDRNDRLIGAEYSRGVSIAYAYDGNGNLIRQTVLSRANKTNGLPVLWSILNGLTNKVDPYADPDGDGWSNYQEWLAGTSPTNANSQPSLLNNPGTSIASLSLPFPPSNFVLAAGNLDGLPGDEIMVGADGSPGTNPNSLFILTQTATNWSTQQVSVGSLGITSIAVGQPTNRPSPAIYIGLRQTGGTRAIWELVQTNGMWLSNVVAVSTDEAAFVFGVRSDDILATFATNGQDAALWSVAFGSGGWTQTTISTNSARRGLGTHGPISYHTRRDSSVQLLNADGIELVTGSSESYRNGSLLPSVPVFNPTTARWHFLNPSLLSWSAARNAFTNLGAEFSLPRDATENAWMSSHFTSTSWIGLYFLYENLGAVSSAAAYYADGSLAGPPISPWTFYKGTAFSLPGFPSGALLNFHGQGIWGAAMEGNPFTSIGNVRDPVSIYTNRWLLPEPRVRGRFVMGGLSLAVGVPRPGQTDSTSVIYAFADDYNTSGQLDIGDRMCLVEYIVSENSVTTNTLVQIPINSGNVAQSFGIAVADFTGTGQDIVFTGDPDGRVYSWTATDIASPLERQLFSDAYVGNGWEAMCRVQMPTFGQALAGVVVAPTN